MINVDDCCFYFYMEIVRPGNTTNLNIFFSIENKKELLRWDSNPRHTAYEADALPTELPRQLCWLGRIKAVQGKGNQPVYPNLINRQTLTQHVRGYCSASVYVPGVVYYASTCVQHLCSK